VGTGPMPGSTPIREPRRQPSRPQPRLSRVSATENPSIRLSSNSIYGPSLQKARPERENKAQAPDEGQPHEDHQENACKERDFPVEVVACNTTGENQQEYGDIDAQDVHKGPGQDHRTDDDDKELEIEPFHFGFVSFLFERAQSDDCAKQSQADAKPEREITGTHTGSRSHRVLRCTEGKPDPQDNEHDSGPEVLLISKLHVDEPLLQLKDWNRYGKDRHSKSQHRPGAVRKVPNGN